MENKQSFIFEIKIGDWSADGHGQCDAYRVQSNKSVQDAREAYFAAKEKLPEHLCPENFMSDCEDCSLPENVYRDAKAMGFDFLPDVSEDELKEQLRYPDVDSGIMCEYVIWFMKQGDPTLELELLPDVGTLAFYGFDSKGRHIGFFGYGLFGG